MKVQYKLKSNEVVYNISDCTAVYSLSDRLKLYFKDKEGLPHYKVIKSSDIEHIFIERDFKEFFKKENSSKYTVQDLIRAAKHCKYDVNNCIGCPFLSEDPDCYKTFMNAIINLLGGVINKDERKN